MKYLFKVLVLVAVAAIGTVACSESEFEQSLALNNNAGLTLYATVSDPAQTKVSFAEDSEAQTITLDWEAGDSFTLYDSYDAVVDTFTSADGDGKFTSSTAALTLVDGDIYTAIYNENADPLSQNGDEINNLSAACKMVATFIPGEDEVMSFKHTMAVMTFKFESDERPAQLIFEDGETTYTVTYEAIEPSNGVYTSHIMIYPSGDGVTSRTLTFSLYNSEGTAYDVRTVDTAKEYIEGCRYTASVSDLENIMWSGQGTADAPYQISSAAQLRLLSSSVSGGTSYSGVYFELTDNIDLGGVDADGNLIEENTFTSIGNNSSCYFKGTFNGAGKEITGLYINASVNMQGLFGAADGATIKNLKVGGSVILSNSFHGALIVGYAINSTIESCETLDGSTLMGGLTGSYSYFAGVVGYSKETTITGCVNRADITAPGIVGGISGSAFTSSIIKNCYNEGTISTPGNYAGGVAGSLRSSSIIINCFNIGDVTVIEDSSGALGAGGVTGLCETAYVYNSYNAGTVISASKYAAGLAGVLRSDDYSSLSSNYAYMYNCYNSGSATGDSRSGVIAGCIDYSIVYDCYYDTDVSGLDAEAVNFTSDVAYSDHGYVSGITTEQMKGSDFVDALNNAASIYNINAASNLKACKWIQGTDGYPILDTTEEVAANTQQFEGSGTEADPYELSSAADLVMLADFVNYGAANYKNCHLKLTCDVDLGGIDSDGNGVKANEFKSIGTVVSSFQGTFDGGGHTVEGLYINALYMYNKALFGYVKYATLKNLVVSGSVSAYSIASGVVGYASSSTVTNCGNMCDVTVVKNAGGVVGHAYGTDVASCWNAGSVQGTGVGGIAAYHTNYPSITNCYNIGSITALASASYVGGIIGFSNAKSENITYCYNAGAVVGSAINKGGVIGCSMYTLNATNYWVDDIDDAPTVGAVIDYSDTNEDLSVPMSAADMKLSTFVDNLNSGQTSTPWQSDYTTPINNGYPILSWQCEN